jgi:hypothetical protein
LNLVDQLLFPPPVSDGTLPPWYQPPSQPNSDPPQPPNSSSLTPGRQYTVFYDAELLDGTRSEEGFFTTLGPFSGPVEFATIPDLMFRYIFTISVEGENRQIIQQQFFAEFGRSQILATVDNRDVRTITNIVGATQIKRNSSAIGCYINNSSLWHY